MKPPLKPITPQELSEILVDYSDFGEELESRDFKEFILINQTVDKASLSESSFINANLQDSTIYDTDAFGVDLTGANMDNMIFLDVRMPRCIFVGASMNRTVFIRCDMADGDFRGAAMADCLFWDNKLSGTYDQATTFPTGFDPADHGLKEVA